MKNKIVLGLIFLLALSFRINGLFDNHPFWVDEFSSAKQAKLILTQGIRYFIDPQLGERTNIITHALIAGSFALFGEHEWVARFPFAIIGSLVPVMVFIFTRSLFSYRTALGASLLTIFSYFQITWSRQARGYVLLELLILILFYLYYLFFKKPEKSRILYALFIAVVVLGILTHFAFYIALTSVVAHFFITNKDKALTILKDKYFYIICGFILLILHIMGILKLLLVFFFQNPFKANNLWFYHSFLWREYGLISFLTILGIVYAGFKNFKQTLLFILYLGFYLFFFLFMFSPYVSRYLLPLFPFFFIFTSISINVIIDSGLARNGLPDWVKNYGSKVSTLIIIGIIVVNGNKFDFKPNRFYSVNHDFREIALIDYDRVYNRIIKKGELDKGKTAVIDTWHDRLYWYLGNNFNSAYFFRWIDDNQKTNGLLRKTNFIYNQEGEKIIPGQANLHFIGELSDLIKTLKKFPKGFIFIDDVTMPQDVVNYAQNNFNIEIYLDHYPLDDNPYSIWPATLYSWGFDKK